jgi:hypothetical protein
MTAAMSADDWAERVGWTWDLISDDPGRREEAHRILDQARMAYSEALGRYNAVWNQPGNEGPRAEWNAAGRRLLPEALWMCWPGTPYKLLYLRWEQLFPNEWTWHVKSWSVKTSVLRDFTRRVHQLPDRYLRDLSDQCSVLIRLVDLNARGEDLDKERDDRAHSTGVQDHR